MKIEYIIIEKETKEELEEIVNDSLTVGYELVGGVACGYGGFSQAMIRRSE